MRLTSTPALLRAVVEILQAKLPVEVQAYGLPALTAIQDWEPPAGTMAANTPLVWVNIPRIRPGSPAGAGGPNATHTRTRTIEVFAAVAGQDQSATNAALYAYTDLIQAIISASRNPKGQGHWLRWRGTDYSPNAGRQTTALYREGVVLCECDLWQELGAD